MSVAVALRRLADRRPLSAAESRDAFFELMEGRASESSFDTRPSPVGTFLHQAVGEAAMMDGVEKDKRWWAGASDPDTFLSNQPRKPAAAIARAAAHIMEIRRDRLFTLAERLEAGTTA